MSQQNSTTYPNPEIDKLIRQYAKTVLKENPEDIISFSARYFENLSSQTEGEALRRKRHREQRQQVFQSNNNSSSEANSNQTQDQQQQSETKRLSDQILSIAQLSTPQEIVDLLNEEVKSIDWKRFPQRKLLKMVKYFVTYCSEDRTIDEEILESIFMHVFPATYHRLKPFFERIFNIFDEDKSESLDLIELVKGVATMVYGSTNEKMDLLLRLIDYNDDNTLQLQEVLVFFKKWYMSKNHGYNVKISQWKSIQNYITRCFYAGDEDQNGVLERAEFHRVASDPDSPIAVLLMSLDDDDETLHGFS